MSVEGGFSGGEEYANWSPEQSGGRREEEKPEADQVGEEEEEDRWLEREDKDGEGTKPLIEVKSDKELLASSDQEGGIPEKHNEQVDRRLMDIDFGRFYGELRDIVYDDPEQGAEKVKALLDKNRVGEMLVEDREKVFEVVMRQFKNMDQHETMMAFRDAGRPVPAGEDSLTGPTAIVRRRELQERLAEITGLYTLPVQEIYDYLRIGPKHGGETIYGE